MVSLIANMATHGERGMYHGSEDKSSNRLLIFTTVSISILLVTGITVGILFLTTDQIQIPNTPEPKSIIVESTTTETTSTTTLSKFPEICLSDQIGDGICQPKNARVECDFDNNDCCALGKFQNDSIGNGICDSELDHGNCSYDGNDCRTKDVLKAKYPDCKYLTGSMNGIGDGYCDDVYNSKQCGFDEGDCCLHESMLNKEYCLTCACFTAEEESGGI